MKNASRVPRLLMGEYFCHKKDLVNANLPPVVVCREMCATTVALASHELAEKSLRENPRKRPSSVLT